MQVNISMFFYTKHSVQEHAKTLQEEELDFAECCGDYSFEAMLEACEASVEGPGGLVLESTIQICTICTYILYTNSAARGGAGSFKR